MTISRKTYYRSEVFRAIIYPIVFIIVIFLFVQFRAYYGENVDLTVYWNIAFATLVATLICYGLSYSLIKPKKRRRKRKSR